MGRLKIMVRNIGINLVHNHTKSIMIDVYPFTQLTNWLLNRSAPRCIQHGTLTYLDSKFNMFIHVLISTRTTTLSTAVICHSRFFTELKIVSIYL